jgi:hypothetical protein
MCGRLQLCVVTQAFHSRQEVAELDAQLASCGLATLRSKAAFSARLCSWAAARAALITAWTDLQGTILDVAVLKLFSVFATAQVGSGLGAFLLCVKRLHPAVRA